MPNNVLDNVISKLNEHSLVIVSKDDKQVHLDGDYCIEIERENLYKLKQGDMVVAPFDNMEEMCQFIKMDIALNEEN